MSRKKCHCAPHEEHADETWLVPYADILTLLLALFIVLFSSSNLDKKKAGQLEQAFTAAFSSAPTDNMSGTLLNLMEELNGLDLSDNIALGSDSQGALIEIANIDMFEQRNTQIRPESIDAIEKIAELLKENKYKRFGIVIEGHTDTEETDLTSFTTKWDLSAGRAASVVKEFIKAGIDPSRFKAIGMADIAPKYPNHNPYGEKIPENQKKNRRVVIRVEP